MKIMVKGDADASIDPCPFQNLNVVSTFHTDIDDMNRLKAVLAKDGCCPWGETLIEQNTLYATRSKLKWSSSTVAAAKRSACWMSSGSGNG